MTSKDLSRDPPDIEVHALLSACSEQVVYSLSCAEPASAEPSRADTRISGLHQQDEGSQEALEEK